MTDKAQAEQARHLRFLKSSRRRRESVVVELENATTALRDAVREAHAAGVPKVDLARFAGISRPTVDAWLKS